MMTTWENYEKVTTLISLCEEKGMVVRHLRDGYFIRANSERYPAFVGDNNLYSAPSVDQAISWIQGLFSDNWRKAMEEK